MQAEFMFDIASPNAYLAARVLPAIERRTGVSFTYTPVLLGGIFKATNNKSPFLTFAGVPSRLAYEQLELARFVKKHAVPFQMNPFFPIDSLLPMRVITGAALDGALRPCLDAALHHMWEAPKKLDAAEVLHAALKESGLDADRLLQRAKDQQVKDTLRKNTEDAVARGAFGIPTFFVNGAMFFGKDRLRDVEEEILHAQPAS
jgi:2-hydroxychromene-2-carboxylate isomerase